MVVKFVVPKGSLEEGTYDIFRGRCSGWRGAERTYRPVVDDPEIEVKVLRPQEIPILVAGVAFNIGITEKDWVRETCVTISVEPKHSVPLPPTTITMCS